MKAQQCFNPIVKALDVQYNYFFFMMYLLKDYKQILYPSYYVFISYLIYL
jgi:hypothetical protein